jgi:hypothetical protein
MEEFNRFKLFVMAQCSQHGVEFRPFDLEYIELSDSIRCSGYFESPNVDKNTPAVLVYAERHPDAPLILVHEYAHMTQWLDELPLWHSAADSIELVDLWLEGEEIDSINEHIRNALNLELDNEKRSVSLIKEWGLLIDPVEYIKKSNAYLQFYLYLMETRKWSSPERSPYMVKEVVEAMSPDFDMDYSKLDPKIRQIFIDSKI